jgi:primosomal protein N' (replication factor Y)
MSETPVFADIILPLAISESYTYRIPDEMIGKLSVGMRIVAPLGQRKLYTGIIKNIHNEKPAADTIKEIEDIIDNEIIIRESQFKLWDWLSDYYMCSLGEVMKAALPAGLKLESESRFILNESFDQKKSLSATQVKIFETILKHEKISLNELSDISKIKKVQPHVNSLIEKNAIFLEEKLRRDYSPKKEMFLRISKKGKQLVKNPGWEENFKRAPKQKLLLTEINERTLAKKGEIKQSLLYESYSLNIINSLFKKELIEKYEVESLRDQGFEGKKRDLFTLSSEQSEAYNNLKEGFQRKRVQLLHGVTSSGKTEIYLHLIKQVIDSGEQVLYLLPEIALTSQIVERIKQVFGDEIAVYHSRFNDSERVDVYKGLLSSEKEEKKLILGVRSAIFLPFRKLGLIIVDEEHENTFKQYDPAPRYHARDSAIVLAGIHDSRVLLGTATPSVETYLNCKTGKYGLVELKERFGGVQLPEISIVDIRKARLKKEMRSVFSPVLIREMEEALKKGKQIILFQNRRGYSSFLECESCGWIPRCNSCDVSLTYHKFGNNLRCHYCGYSKRIPELCSDCNSSRLVTRGFGTELVEDELELILPGTRIARLDLDSTRTKRSYERILSSFAMGSTDILVGTQMLSKGLDFENVALVGILNADQMLNFPDFRAFERSFQLMSQVSGRAGRKKERGKVIIQTSDPSHPIINNVLKNDFLNFYKDQVFERQEFKYPPYVRIIKLVIKSKDINEGRKAAEEFGKKLREIFGKRILGPQAPVVSRVKTWYLHQILIKVERKASFQRARTLLKELIAESEKSGILKKVRINIDVDPL